jgi:PilZ domain/Gram-negative bacterial TonB protein C-terminal
VLTSAEHLASPESGVERRFYPRVAPSGLISVAFADGNVGMLLNLSENGLLVSTPLALPENFVCRISLLLSGLANAIEVYVRVVWTAGALRAGIQFLDLSEHDREQIRKWAEVEEAQDPNQQQNEAPQAREAPQTVNSSKKTPSNVPNIRFSRTQLLAGVVAAVAMLAMAVALRGTSHRWLPGTLSFTWKNTLAIQPGGAAWGEPLDKQASNAGPLVRNDLASQVIATGSHAAPGVSSAANENAALSNTAPKKPSRSEDSPSHKPGAPKENATATPAKTATAIASSPAAHNGAKTRVRNPAVLAAQNHFGNQYVGHLDLADSGANHSGLHEAEERSAAPANTAAASTSAKEPANDSAPPSGATSADAQTPPQPSAIAGSIMGKGAPNLVSQEDLPANLALLNSTGANSARAKSASTLSEPRAANPVPAEPRDAVSAAARPIPPAPVRGPATNSGSTPSANVANTNTGAAARTPPVPGSSSSVSAANSTGIAPAAPLNRFWQVTLPGNGRASFVNLPGEQVLQSQGVTMHIQRSVLAPAAAASNTTASLANASRTETVHVGELLSHVEPWTPRLTQETGARVSVRAYLSADGRVERLVPVNGSVTLVSSAARAVREWRFAPTLLGGKPVQTAAYVVVEFHPQSDGSEQP